jgi:predicted nucleotidyltransferase
LRTAYNKLFTLFFVIETVNVALKPERHFDIVEVTYNIERWALLSEFRKRAQRLLSGLIKRQIEAVVHGSIARGDVTQDSDIDVFIPNPPSSFQIENALEQAQLRISARLIIQATPVYAMKGYIELEEATVVSFPLMALRRVEKEFYRFGGEVTLDQLDSGARVAGVDKRLMLIEPTDRGHVESSILGKEEVVAKILGISVETVSNRVNALMRRDMVGRTGVFVKRELSLDETFELLLKRLADENPAVRRRLRGSFKGG